MAKKKAKKKARKRRATPLSAKKKKVKKNVKKVAKKNVKMEVAIKKALAEVGKAESKIAEGRDELRAAMERIEELLGDTDQAMLDVEGARLYLQSAVRQGRVEPRQAPVMGRKTGQYLF